MFKENASEIQLKRKQTTSHKFREREKLILCSPSLDETLFPKPHQWSESHSYCLSKLLAPWRSLSSRITQAAAGTLNAV